MARILDFEEAQTRTEENMPHKLSELICLKCLHRFLCVRPVGLPLSMIECSCGETGYCIETGEVLEEIEE